MNRDKLILSRTYFMHSVRKIKVNEYLYLEFRLLNVKKAVIITYHQGINILIFT